MKGDIFDGISFFYLFLSSSDGQGVFFLFVSKIMELLFRIFLSFFFIKVEGIEDFESFFMFLVNLNFD